MVTCFFQFFILIKIYQGESVKSQTENIELKINLIYGCRSVNPAKWATPFVVWGACDAVCLRVEQADHLDDHFNDDNDDDDDDDDVRLKRDVTSSVLVVETREKKESLRPRVLLFGRPTL